MKSIHAALLAGASILLTPVPAFAQTEAAAPMSSEASEIVLPANTEVVLTLNESVSSKTHRLGDKFSLTLAQDVKVEGRTLIPQGTRAVGQVTTRTGRGSFGKSGKMDIMFRYLDYNGQRIPLEGRHHQEGSGATAATIGAVVAAGVVGGLLVKGKSARIAEGREFTTRTLEAIPAMVPADAGAPAMIAASYSPSQVSMEAETKKERKAREKAERAARN